MFVVTLGEIIKLVVIAVVIIIAILLVLANKTTDKKR